MTHILRFALLCLCAACAIHPSHAQGFLDYERGIGDGYRIFRANSMEVCIADSKNSVLVSPMEHPGVGPVVAYATTRELILTRNTGRKPRNRFPGDSLQMEDPTQTYHFIVRKGSNQVIGPLTPTAFEQHALVQPLGRIRWEKPGNPLFVWVFAVAGASLLAIIVGVGVGVFWIRRAFRQRGGSPPSPAAS